MQPRIRGPPSGQSPQGAISDFSVDKQRALAVFFNHDERDTNRPVNYLRWLLCRVPALREASQWPP